MTTGGLVISELAFGRGRLGLCPLPGRSVQGFAADLASIVAWAPEVVLTLTGAEEMAGHGAGALGAALEAAGIGAVHLPVPDYGTPGPEAEARWPGISRRLRAVLVPGGRVLVHCLGGCGRSGMIALRLMIEAGEPAAPALARLREARPCAIETGAQHLWARAPRALC